MKEINENDKRQIEKVVAWAQKHNILLEFLTLEQFKQALKNKK
jgi:hypothetical protein